MKAVWLRLIAAASAGTILAAAALSLPPDDAVATAQRVSCSNYPNQAAAQAAYRANAAGLTQLDRDDDGVACEDNSPPCDLEEVVWAGVTVRTPRDVSGPCRTVSTPPAAVEAPPPPAPPPATAPPAAAESSPAPPLGPPASPSPEPATEAAPPSPPASTAATQLVLPAVPASTPEETIAEFSQLNFPEREYAGACGNAQLPDDAGKLCSLFRDERDDGLRAYLFGLAFAGTDRYVFVALMADGWLVVWTDLSDPERGEIPWPPRQ